MELISNLIGEFTFYAFGAGSRIAVFYLSLTVLLAFGIWLFRGRPKPFLSWLLPARVYLHRSNLVDIKLFIASRVLGAVGLFSAALFTPLVTFVLLGWLLTLTPDAEPHTNTFWRNALVTLLVVMAADFVKYWAHRLHHEYEPLWSFHAVHHSAEVLTPLTVTRVHPVETLIRNVGISTLVGITQAVALFAIVGSVDLLTLGGANILYVIFNAAGANLRHSHIWLSYGPVMEHIFISPAQHQVHHSMDLKHHNKNYGSMFAIWDWMFGTLYVPRNGPEDLRFGVADANGVPLPQQFPTLKAALFVPFLESAKGFRARLANPSRTDIKAENIEP